MSDLEGKVVIITGSSRGIGIKTARLLHSLGAKVVINGRDEEQLLRAGESIDPEGRSILAVAGNVRDEHDSKRLMEAAYEKWGRIDALVCNAGVTQRGRFEELSTDVLRTVVETNIHGSMFPALHGIPYLRHTGGSIVIISSLAGLRGLPSVSVYSASKMALTGFADSLRMELRSSGIHVGILYVGFAENDPGKQILAADGSLIPINRPSHLSQDQVARAVARMIERRRSSVVMSPLGKMLWVLQKFAPWLVTVFLRKSDAKIAEMSK